MNDVEIWIEWSLINNKNCDVLLYPSLVYYLQRYAFSVMSISKRCYGPHSSWSNQMHGVILDEEAQTWRWKKVLFWRQILNRSTWQRLRHEWACYVAWRDCHVPISSASDDRKESAKYETRWLRAVLCTTKLAIFFEAVKTAHCQDQVHKALPPVHLLGALPHPGVGVSTIDDTIPFVVAWYLVLDFFTVTSSILEMLDKWMGNFSKQLYYNWFVVPCIYPTAQM